MSVWYDGPPIVLPIKSGEVADDDLTDGGEAALHGLTTQSSALPLVGYLGCGIRLAEHSSQPDAVVVERAPVPQWGWGVPPPYQL
jgi:hypothetical protein